MSQPSDSTGDDLVRLWSMGWLWWQQRQLQPLDPAADGRAYQR